MRQKRSLGQVFLKDKKYIAKILDSLDISGKNVLEIGPGQGEISAAISERAKFLWCVEIDCRFYNYLENKFRQKSNVKIINNDILKFPFSQIAKKTVIFGNVPYHISSRLIKYLIENRKFIDKVYLTFQKEFAQKLLAQPSSKQYNFISCYTQYYVKIKKLFDIPAVSFQPVPKIDSSFIRIDFYRNGPHKAKNEEFLFKIIHKAFSNRRKKIINSLSVPVDILSKFKINRDLRAQDLSLEQYILLANGLYPAYSF